MSTISVYLYVTALTNIFKNNYKISDVNSCSDNSGQKVMRSKWLKHLKYPREPSLSYNILLCFLEHYG